MAVARGGDSVGTQGGGERGGRDVGRGCGARPAVLAALAARRGGGVAVPPRLALRSQPRYQHHVPVRAAPLVSRTQPLAPPCSSTPSSPSTLPNTILNYYRGCICSPIVECHSVFVLRYILLDISESPFDALIFRVSARDFKS